MPKIVDRDAYRLELLSKSFELFARHGYTNVSMRGIAEALGISTGALYHYFSSKQEFFTQIAFILSQSDISKITNLMAQCSSIEERLTLFFVHIREDEEAILNSLLFFADFYRLNLNEDMDNDFIKGALDSYHEVLVNIVGIPPDLATFVFATVDGLIIHRAIEPEKIDIEAQLSLLKEVISTHIQKNE